ncbi:3'-5' exonuclease [Agromyces sp. NPDC058110]|uniref:3'-5' exonuclease n=1 Tax=Agromyces sp. NPDC058110 TaxID=3346345 RepID=UPI0036DD850F
MAILTRFNVSPSALEQRRARSDLPDTMAAQPPPNEGARAMPNVLWSDIKGLKAPELDAAVQKREIAFINKLRKDDTADGLRIKPMTDAADPRARTGRVTQGWRAVLFRFDTSDGVRTYVYAGTWPHDEGNMLAKTRRLEGNPVNGIAEFVDVSLPALPTQVLYEGPAAASVSYLETEHNYSSADLTDVLGFDERSARLLLAATSGDEVLALVDDFPNAWQQHAALALAVGDPLEKIREELAIGTRPADDADHDLTEDDRILRALAHPAAKMQFTYIESDESLQRIIEEGNLGAWRVFLHPEQQRYAMGHWNGPFRLTGGAGTGKTVVLLHRARHLAEVDAGSTVVLTTFTRALAENLKSDLHALDPSAPISEALGKPGILVRGVDQLATAVRFKAGDGFAAASAAIFGTRCGKVSQVTSNDDGWASALAAVAPSLPDSIAHPAFFEQEYLQVILPARVSEADEYFSVRRPGRGVALDRQKRVEVWKVVEAYRANARQAGTVSWAEQAAIAAAWLDEAGSAVGVKVGHVLVDEGQDLSPAHWQFLRALAAPGEDDLFIAEDTHQRIYGQHVVLARYGIRIVGRSRRLTLNYRTTEQNLKYALGVLDGGEYSDSENEGEGTGGYRSARRGPTPSSFAGADDDAQVQHIAELITSWIDEGVEPAGIAVLARTNDRAAAARDGLNRHGIVLNHIKSAQRDGDRPVALTMHTAKGMEFNRVVLFDVSDGVMPAAHALQKLPPEEHEDALLRERSLLYVAASRARDVLVVTWKGEPSPLLQP